MTYSEIRDLEIKHPRATFIEFNSEATLAANQFESNNKIIQKLNNGQFTLEMYHDLLLRLFHQVYYSSTSFALAGSMLESRHIELRDYLMEHAEEEKEHWTWIINDLRNTGYQGPDPRELFPSKEAQAYLSFAMFVALKHPPSRLAMAYVLENLSGNLGIKYGLFAAEQIGLDSSQVTFMVQHGTLDQGHSQDIINVLANADLSEFEWAHCAHTAKTTVSLYRDIYNSISFSNTLVSV